MKRTIFFLMLLCAGISMYAQSFSDYFEERTLRIDYTFSGDATHQVIAVDQLNTMPGWYGKHQRLAELPVEGNGQITVRSHRTGEVATPSPRCFRNGSPIPKPLRLGSRLRTCSSCLCQRIPLM